MQPVIIHCPRFRARGWERGVESSITIGTGLTDAAPGSYRGTHLIVSDIEAARAELVGRGVGVGDIRHMGSGGWTPGPHPDRADYGSFADFSDPDGNTWVLQEVGQSQSGGPPSEG
ncbi:MAG: hypothetical protein ACRDIX_00970 [Actinomycetota bacterium]